MTSSAAQKAANVASLKLTDPSLLREQCYIDGKWVGTPSKAVDNPANGDLIGHVPFFGAAETTQAVEAAERAFKTWSVKTAKERANILRKWFDLIVANLTEKILTKLRSSLVGLLRPRGYLIISGIIIENRAMIEENFLSDPLVLHRSFTEKEWICYVLKKKEESR